MSHASCIVALSPEEIANHGGIEEAIGWNMEPFDEDGAWGREGTRWDWWVIGGRYTGKFSEPGYVPHLDPDNFEVCWLCRGTGKRDDALGYEARLLDPSYTCNGCDGAGKKLKFGDWKPIGNVIKRAELTEDRCRQKSLKDAEAAWPKLAAYIEKNRERPDNIRFIYEVEPDITREQFIESRAANGLTAYAFLRNRQWHECERLGMFALALKTECEIKAESEGVEFTGRCIHDKPECGARIVTWSGEKDSDERWDRLFYARFIRNLPPETTLVVVDYHV